MAEFRLANELFWLIARYPLADKSILVVTEGLRPTSVPRTRCPDGKRAYASAGEMVAAFARGNKLATIVGTNTPGRLLSGGAFKLGQGKVLFVFDEAQHLSIECLETLQELLDQPPHCGLLSGYSLRIPSC